MLCFLKQPSKLLYCVNYLRVKNRRINIIKSYICFVNYASQTKCCSVVQNKRLLVSNDQSRLIISRNKSDSRKKKQRKRYDEESSDEEDEDVDNDEDDFLEKGVEIKTFSVKSMRIDSILKTMLTISRKKVEESFYQNKIRVNGEILYKKSQHAKVNDEIDLIKGMDDNLHDTIVVGRVKILKVEADPDAERILVKAWRNKSLKTNNYEDRNAWREPAPEE